SMSGRAQRSAIVIASSLAPSITPRSPSAEAAYVANSGSWIARCEGAILIIGWIVGTTYDTFPMSELATVGTASTPGSCTVRPRRAALAQYKSIIGWFGTKSAYAGSSHSYVISQSAAIAPAWRHASTRSFNGSSVRSFADRTYQCADVKSGTTFGLSPADV